MAPHDGASAAQQLQAAGIKDLRLLTEREPAYQIDKGVFKIVYLYAVTRILLLWIQGRKEDIPQLYPYLGLILACHVLIKLFMHWNVDVKDRAAFLRARTLGKATHVKVTPVQFAGSKEIVPLRFRLLDDNTPEVSFEYRKQRFVYDRQQGYFQKLRYPTEETFESYRCSSGLTREAVVDAARALYGPNTFQVPIPTFAELLKEQMLAPFFVFQVFCVGLWCLDEYWYYSLFTLGMLVMFESTVVQQRLRSLRELRSLQTAKQEVAVYRFGKWDRINGNDLLPGDLVSICRPAVGDEQTVPADCLLLAGTCIAEEAILTGESTPQWKNPVGTPGGEEQQVAEFDPQQRLNVARDKAHVLFGGTKLLQHAGDRGARIRTPDGGCLAVVLCTGFETAQGRLMRTILYSTERVTANNWETGLFICFLLVFAIAAAAYVLIKGLENEDRSRFKLYLNCTMIITSVIPPELPMELSMAVNTSLLALARKTIFCTEPFRIPFGGKVTICCFDKTGTLTSDNMLLQGIASVLGQGRELLSLVAALPVEVVRVLAGCHSLVAVEGEVVGDPLERAAAAATGWQVGGEQVRSTPLPNGGTETLTILRRFLFSSALKRMSAIVKVEAEGDSAGSTGLWVLVKGAPEVVRGMLSPVPGGYEGTYKHYAAMGARVIALAFKRLPGEMGATEVRGMSRDEAESALTFAGFAIFATPLKSDSEPALRMLAESNHQLVMITGDAPLTACHAAAAVHIVTRTPLILQHKGHSQSAANLSHQLPNVLEPESHYEWVSPDEALRLPFSSAWPELLGLAREYDLCVTGDGLSHIQQLGLETSIIPLTQVFARVSPEQKGLILYALRAVGHETLMCGDGTNDVGALKAAHVGIALLPPQPPKKPGKATAAKGSGKKGGKSVTPAGGALAGGGGAQLTRRGSGAGGLTAAVATGSGSGEPPKQGPGAKMLENLRRAGKPIGPRERKIAEWLDSMEEQGEVSMVKPGDASMAAPFTAKQSSVMPCTDVIKQGRCTLVTMVQMFKILGLLCLSTAYGLSVMYLDGVKLGDVQATMQGFLTAGMFFCISNAKPLQQLSAERPHPHIFCVYLFASLLGQFACHIGFLIHLYNHAVSIMPTEERQLPDTDFQPNLVNTVCFLVNFVIQVITFAVNYVGHPFNTRLVENTGLFNLLRAGAFVYALLVVDPFKVGELMSLVSIPNELQMEMVLGAVAVFATTFAWERLLRAAFPARPPPPKGHMAFPDGAKQPHKLKAL